MFLQIREKKPNETPEAYANYVNDREEYNATVILMFVFVLFFTILVW